MFFFSIHVFQTIVLEWKKRMSYFGFCIVYMALWMNKWFNVVTQHWYWWIFGLLLNQWTNCYQKQWNIHTIANCWYLILIYQWFMMNKVQILLSSAYRSNKRVDAYAKTSLMVLYQLHSLRVQRSSLYPLLLLDVITLWSPVPPSAYTEDNHNYAKKFLWNEFGFTMIYFETWKSYNSNGWNHSSHSVRRYESLAWSKTVFHLSQFHSIVSFMETLHKLQVKSTRVSSPQIRFSAVSIQSLINSNVASSLVCSSESGDYIRWIVKKINCEKRNRVGNEVGNTFIFICSSGNCIVILQDSPAESHRIF